jgi:hypothetical protein
MSHMQPAFPIERVRLFATDGMIFRAFGHLLAARMGTLLLIPFNLVVGRCDLPDRVEQALLFKHLKDRFEPDWHWSNTQHASYSDYAWDQDCSYGYQHVNDKSDEGCARAVRRIAI